MLAKVVDALIYLAGKAGVRPLASMRLIPVLHVERLNDERAYLETVKFARRYHDATGKKAVMTVITPEAPILKRELFKSGFSSAAYEDRIRELAVHSDVGLHGHFTRPDGAHAPVHNYWNERELVAKQLERECEWLESRGLMLHRVYSAGWWYLDDVVVSSLQEARFVFDFSCSFTPYGHSPMAAKIKHVASEGIFSFYDGPQMLAYVPAVSGVASSAARSVVPRRALTYGGPRRDIWAAGVYSHDWDLRVDEAMRTIDDVRMLGAGFISLDELLAERRRVIATRSLEADGAIGSEARRG